MNFLYKLPLKMEVLFRALILLSVTLLAAANVDPNAFECTSKSPSSKPAVYSNTDPPVGLTHVFCGEIDQRGKAVGFHSRYLAKQNSKPGGTNHPPCAKATGKITCASTKVCQKCTFTSQGIEVLNENGVYVKKETNANKPNKFFPDSWKPEFIVDLAIKILEACMPNGAMVEGDKKVCFKDYKIKDHDCLNSVDVFNIVMFTDGKKIVTIFPTDELGKCDYTCPKNVRHSDL